MRAHTTRMSARSRSHARARQETDTAQTRVSALHVVLLQILAAVVQVSCLTPSPPLPSRSLPSPRLASYPVALRARTVVQWQEPSASFRQTAVECTTFILGHFGAHIHTAPTDVQAIARVVQRCAGTAHRRRNSTVAQAAYYAVLHGALLQHWQARAFL